MTLKTVKDKILALLDESAGSDILPLLYKQIDSVQREIACLVKELERVTKITVTEKQLVIPETYGLYEIIRVTDEAGCDQSYMYINGTLYIPNGTYYLFYNIYPDTITETTPDNTPMQISDECCEALVYGVATALSLDDVSLYDTLLSKYNNILVNIQNRVFQNTIADVKGGFWL